MKLHGKNIIGKNLASGGDSTFQTCNPAEGREIEPSFHAARPDEVDRAASLANEAFTDYRQRTAPNRSTFLRRIAEEIESLGDALLDRGTAETALPKQRLIMERGRTMNQLRMFADAVEEGSWVDARIDRGIPDRETIPKPDLRRMLMPLGPVAVFCASNFPLAFSVAGGDTASALAAGNPVIVKAHGSHPGTAELVATAVARAAKATKMHEGIFSMVHGAGHQVGVQLVEHPAIQAVGFTGSESGGRALFDAAASRPVPIPVYAEMGSINPVFILPQAAEARGSSIAEGLAQSVALGVGQFCTCPGLVVGMKSKPLDRIIRESTEKLQSTQGVMLNDRICGSYGEGIQRCIEIEGVEKSTLSSAVLDEQHNTVAGVLMTTDAETFLANPSLREEVFGPVTLVVQCADRDAILQVASSVTGNLASTLHATDDELAEYIDLIRVLELKSGRLVHNGFPTGVEVCPSMNHGGPYPACTDIRSTSVGTAAMLRFVRPICFQAFLDGCLPVELQNENPRNIWRQIDGELTKESIS